MQRKKPHVVKEKRAYTPFPPPQQPSKVRSIQFSDCVCPVSCLRQSRSILVGWLF